MCDIVPVRSPSCRVDRVNEGVMDNDDVCVYAFSTCDG